MPTQARISGYFRSPGPHTRMGDGLVGMRDRGSLESMAIFPRLFFLHAMLLAAASAESVWLEDVGFEVTRDAGFGNSVFIAGSAAALGGWDVTKAVKLRWSGSNVWRGTVALPRGVTTHYRPFVRAESPSAFADAGSVLWLGSDAVASVTDSPAAPYRGKTIYYLSAWQTPHILWRNLGGEWTNSALLPAGGGRFPGENLYALKGIGTPGRPLEFVPNDGGSQWDNPGGVANTNYTALPDAVFLQDGQVYDFRPPARPSAPRIVEEVVLSTREGIVPRRVRVMLPRGYDENPGKRYPVLYLHDGQNVFDPGGSFGSWSADATVTREIASGRIREILVVAVDNSSARMMEYRPPGDLYQGADGIGDRYRDFLIHNVKPWVDARFRTLPGASNHALIGSSLGGLITHYIGMTSDVFGLLGVMSPSYWIAPNFRAVLAAAGKPERRIWLDWGSSEGAGMWDYAWPGAEMLDAKGMVRGRDLQVLVGAGDSHNEAAWKRRLPEALRFLFPITDGANALLLDTEGPPDVAAQWNSSTFVARFFAIRGFRYTLERSPTLQNPDWSVRRTLAPAEPWRVVELEDIPPTTLQQFYRVRMDVE